MQLRATASPGPLDDTAAPPSAVDDAGAVGGSSAPLWKQALAFAANLIPGNPPPAWKPVHRDSAPQPRIVLPSAGALGTSAVFLRKPDARRGLHFCVAAASTL
jgi:hypothetical protein